MESHKSEVWSDDDQYELSLPSNGADMKDAKKKKEAPRTPTLNRTSSVISNFSPFKYKAPGTEREGYSDSEHESSSGEENAPHRGKKLQLPPAELKARTLSPRGESVGLSPRSPSISSISYKGVSGDRAHALAASSQINMLATLDSKSSSKLSKSKSTPYISFGDSPVPERAKNKPKGLLECGPLSRTASGALEGISRTGSGSMESVNRARAGSLESGSRNTQRPNSRSASRPVTPENSEPSRAPTPTDRIPSRSTTPTEMGRAAIGGAYKQHRTSMKYPPMLFSKKEADVNMQQIMQVLASLQDSKAPLADRRAAMAKLTDVLGEESSAVQQRLHVLLRPLQQQLISEVEICKDVCGFLQTLARNQPAPDKLLASYVNFASQIITQLLEIVSAGVNQKREFVMSTLERLIDGTQTKDTLGILVCFKYTHNQANTFLLDLLALLQRAVQNWDPEFFCKTTHINMLVEPLSGLVQSKSEKVQAIALQCVKQLSTIAPPAFEKRVVKSLPPHLKAKVSSVPNSPPIPPATITLPSSAPPVPAKKSILTLRKTPKKLKLLLSEPKPVTPPPPVKPPKPVLSRHPEVGATIEVSGVTYLVEKVIFKSQSGEGGVYRVYHKEEDTRYAYKIVVGDVESSELNSLLTMQDSNYVIKIINSEVVDDDTTHLITELGEVNMEDYILDHWDKWTHNKIRSVAEEILFAIRDIHLVSFIHGDITPRNFVLVKGSLKLIDFGLTRSLPPATSNILVPINQMKGSPDFLPPEVFRASRRGPFELYKYSNGVDLWAAGVILHLMATGLTPFAGMSDVQISELTEMPPIIDLGYPHLQDLLAQMLSYDISARPTLDVILAHPFFGGSPAPSLTRQDLAWSKLNRLSVSSTSSEGNDTDSTTSSSHLSYPPATSSHLSSYPPATTPAASAVLRDSPISPRSLTSLHGLSPTHTPTLPRAPHASAPEPAQENGAHAHAQAQEVFSSIEDNPLALLTPSVNRKSVPTPISPQRTLTSQDSKLALFGNLFGPAAHAPAPAPSDDVILSHQEEGGPGGLVQTMQAFNLTTQKGGVDEEEHE